MAGQFGNIVRDKGVSTGRRSMPGWRTSWKTLGYVIDRRGGKEWEIAGVPQSVIDKFSKRTAQIEAEAEKLGITDAAAKPSWGQKSGPRSRRS